MKEKNPSFNLIYRSTFSYSSLQSNEGETSITHAAVLSNLQCKKMSYPISSSFVADCMILLSWKPQSFFKKAIVLLLLPLIV